MVVYLDCNATTPIEPLVAARIRELFEQQCGNAGSPHALGRAAKEIVHQARDQIARIVGARRHEVVLTSGATESNNLAILGLAHHQATGKRHLVSTAIEHHAVLEPLAALRDRGFEVTLVPPQPSGRVDPAQVLAAVRPDTLLVSVMHVNNETGIIQPIDQIAESLADRDCYFHVDAAQGFGKEMTMLRHPRLDLISISSHKIFGPAGVGCLIIRRPAGRDIPLSPILFGGGQELGLRSGTLPVPLIAGFGLAAEMAERDHVLRMKKCREIGLYLQEKLAPLTPLYHGDLPSALPHVVYVSFPGWDAEEVIDAWDDLAAVSTGSACTSVCATASHVLAAMGVRGEPLDGAVRLSWCHLTDLGELKALLPQMVARLAARAPALPSSQESSETTPCSTRPFLQDGNT